MDFRTKLFEDYGSMDLEDVTSSVRSSPMATVSTLQEIVDSDLNSFNRSYLVRETGQDAVVVQEILSVLCELDRLTAFITVRCPECSTDHGSYYRRSNIPDEDKLCFNCEETFNQDDELAWNVRYEFP